jgi:hypothetical protein
MSQPAQTSSPLPGRVDLSSLPTTPPPPSLAPVVVPIGSRTLSGSTVYLGCDPEFFFEKDGKIIGAEKVIKDQLKSSEYSRTTFVLDGVQVELNPNPGTCRQSLASEIQAAFQRLRTHLSTLGEVKANFTTCIDLSQEELDSLSDRAKVLGCAPSLHREGDEEAKKALINIDAAKVTSRSAGGHIHLGLDNHIKSHAAAIVDLLDILVGNTCVLIDRDPNAPERRKLYGRAGEYRLPAHGLEYRTLSNFWLRHYVLMSFVMGAARYAVNVQATEINQENNRKDAKTHPSSMGYTYDTQCWAPASELLSLIGGPKGLSEVRKVINANDRDGALETWEKVKTFIQQLKPGYSSGFDPAYLANMDAFFAGIHKDGIQTFFPDNDLVLYWATMSTSVGWERWITNTQNVKKYLPVTNRVATTLRTVAEKLKGV